MKSSLPIKHYFLLLFSFSLIIGVFSACEENDTEPEPDIKIVSPEADAQIIKGAEVKVTARLNDFDLHHKVHSIQFTIDDSTYFHDTTKKQNFSFLWRTKHLSTGEYNLNMEVKYSDESLNDKDWNYFNSRDYIDEYIDGEGDEPDTIITKTNVSTKLTDSPESNLNLDFKSFAQDTFDYNSKTIILSSFKISKYEITNEQFCSFLNEIGANENGYYADIKYIHISKNNQIDYKNGTFEPATNADDSLPITNVTWYGAKNFCNWAGGRLPTESEWIYCAKGTDVSNLDTIAWYKNNAEKTIHEVGKKAPNHKGLYDIFGNAAEWCMDGYSESMYSSSASTLTNPTAPKNQAIKVYKGGHWNSEASQIGVEKRFKEEPGNGGNYLGFRLVIPEP